MVLSEISLNLLSYPFCQWWADCVTDLPVLVGFIAVELIAIRETHESGILPDAEWAISLRHTWIKYHLMAFIFAIVGEEGPGVGPGVIGVKDHRQVPVFPLKPCFN